MILGPKRERGSGKSMEILHHMFHYLQPSPDVIWLTKSRRLRKKGTATGISAYRVWWGKLKKGEHLEGLVLGGKIIFKCILK